MEKIWLCQRSLSGGTAATCGAILSGAALGSSGEPSTGTGLLAGGRLLPI